MYGLAKLPTTASKPNAALIGARFEPAVEHVARALGEQIEHVALPGEVERAKALRDLPRVEQRAARRPPDVRRRREEQLAQHVGDAIEHRVIRGQRFGVAPRILRDFRLRGLEPAADLEIPAVRQRQEIRERPLDDRKPVLGRACRSRITFGLRRLTV